MAYTSARLGPLLLFALAYTLANGQNLVPNYSFEEHSDCPDAFNLIELSTHWHKSSVNNLPPHHVDYIHTCGSGDFHAPNTYWGFQAPATGDAHAAISTRSPLATDYRENIFVELIAPMIPGVSYTLSMRVSHTDLSKSATNNLGIRLGTSPYFPIDNTSHMHSTSVVADHDNWLLLSGTIIADSAYTYVGIGNFYTDANTTMETVCPGCPYLHNEYYIDDICVAPSTAGRSPVLCNVPFDPTSGVHGAIPMTGWSLVSNSTTDGRLTLLRGARYSGPVTISVLDASGRIIAPTKQLNGPGPLTLDMSSLVSGCYMLRITGQWSTVLRFLVER